jgi:uncharacterized protein with FMN-binding domain
MRRVILAICATAVGLVLLLSFKTHTQTAAPGASPAAALGSPSPGPSGTAASTGTASTAGGTTGQTAPASTGAAKTVTGAAWPTIYGPVQVRVTVKAGKLSAVTAVEYPTDTPRDYQINTFAVPQLNAEALAAGSAKIDTVSGATYTSGGYVGSLQNALDKAGL